MARITLSATRMSLGARRHAGTHAALRQPCRSLHHWSDPAGRSKHRHLFYDAHRYGDEYPFSLSDTRSLFVHNEDRTTRMGRYTRGDAYNDWVDSTCDDVRRRQTESEREPWVTVTYGTLDERAEAVLLTEELGSDRWVATYLRSVRVTELGVSPYGFLKYGIIRDIIECDEHLTRDACAST